MSQVIFSSIDPAISGTTLATTLNSFKDAIVSGCSGTSRPAALQAGGSWVDTSSDPTSWTYKMYTGSADISIFTINLTTGLASVALAVDSFNVEKISADTVGAIMQLVKNRIATNGQVLGGDVVGEIRVTGRTNTSTNPVVAKIIFTATDNMTSSASGGTLSFQSTPGASATLTEHMRFITGLVETVVPHKLNSLILVEQDVATAATIAQMSASKVLVEMTGSTTTDVQGINSANDSKRVSIHNRSSAVVTLKHQNASANAADRLKLPNSVDYKILADGTATLYYCSTDTRWKLLSTAETNSGVSVDKLFGVTQTWTAPTNTTAVRLRSFRTQNGAITERSGMVDSYGNAFAWGANANGQLGVGDVTPRSSPVAVLGALSFTRTYGQTGAANSCFGVSNVGAAYGWGANTNGQLGLGDVIPRSSPVAVLGSLKFGSLVQRDASVFGFTSGNQPFAWGLNTNGQLGVGDVTPRSSPVAVLGSLRFRDIVSASGASTNAAAVALTSAGAAYAWGINTNGNLGLGDVASRSSPVAVLGSLTLADVKMGAVSSRYSCVGLTTAGAAYAWGANTNSNLGVGDQTARSSPVAVLGGLVFQRIFLHEKSESVFALTSAGALYGWGDNTQGVLGDGTIINKSSPIAVLGSLAFVRVIPYKSSIFAITADGTLYAWGNNANGQLGVGDVTSRSSPVAVLGSLKFVDVAIADGPSDTYGIYGLTGDGLLYSWGVNANGTLGLGDVTSRSSPVAVLGAFSPDPREVIVSTDLTVTGGSSYTVGLGAGNAYFGGVSLGRDVYRIEVEYLQ